MFHHHCYLFGFCFLAAFLTTSCSAQPEPDADRVIRVDFTSIQERIPFSDFVRDIDFLPLKRTENFLVSRVDLLKTSGQRILLFDSNANAIYAFDRHDGRHLFSIDNRSADLPLFRKEVSDFVGLPDGRIIVYIRDQFELIFFDRQGRLSHTVFVDFVADEMDLLGKDQLIFFTNYDANHNDFSNVLITDFAGEIINRELFFDRRLQKVNLDVGNSQYVNAGKIFHSDLIRSCLYSYDKSGEPTLNYRFDFGRHQLPKEKLYDRTFMEVASDKDFGQYAYLQEAYDLPESVFFTYSFGGEKIHLGLYDKNSRSVRSFSSVSSDILAGGYINLPLEIEGSVLVSVLDSEFLNMIRQQLIDQFGHADVERIEEEAGDIPESGEAFIRVLSDIDLNSNPVVIFYRLKN
ncbi:MAG: 6-bladed beta-propeller [Saprospiraceae bacterium]|nr:6-bladed beta-propeller [Saprospiraceae bacterium]